MIMRGGNARDRFVHRPVHPPRQGNAGMRVLQVMADIDPSRGGPSSAVRGLARALARAGHTVDVTSLSPRGGSAPRQEDGYRILSFRTTFGPWQHGREYARWLRRHAAEYDLVVIHSLFLSHTFWAARACAASGTPYVVRPHGSLTTADLERRRSRLKALYLRLIDRRALTGAVAIWCTGESEAADVRALGYTNVVIIPLGVDAPPPGFTRRPDRGQLLFLGRVTAKKRLDLAVAAVAKLVHAGVDVSLVVAGPDEAGRTATLQAAAAEARIADRVDWRGLVDATGRAELFATAGALVLPSEGENFGIAVAEGLAHGVPAIISDQVSHAPAVDRTGAGLVTGVDVDSVRAAVDTLVGLPAEDYAAMCAAAAELGQTYSWEAAARAVTALAPKEAT
jgi:glycosyltransferase involved in cell wall biosynthesis